MTEHAVSCSILEELFEIGARRAAAGLGQLIDRPVEAGAPTIRVLNGREVRTFIDDMCTQWVFSIRQRFHGGMSGDALLLVTEDGADSLVGILVGEPPSDFLTEAAAAALTEVANIMLNAYLGSLANLLDGELSFEVPRFRTTAGQKLGASNLGEYIDPSRSALLITTIIRVGDEECSVSILLLTNAANIQMLCEG